MAAHTNVCVIGLGSMGMGAARACLQAGLNTLTSIPTTVAHCWRRAPKARARGAVRRGTGCSCCWWSMPPGAGILFGESGLAAHLKPGTVVMVSSTIASADAQAIAEALAEYQLMLDAPVSGGAGKRRRRMTVMASGAMPPLPASRRCWTPWPATASGRRLVLARR